MRLRAEVESMERRADKLRGRIGIFHVVQSIGGSDIIGLLVVRSEFLPSTVMGR